MSAINLWTTAVFICSSSCWYSTFSPGYISWSSWLLHSPIVWVPDTQDCGMSQTVGQWGETLKTGNTASSGPSVQLCIIPSPTSTSSCRPSWVNVPEPGFLCFFLPLLHPAPAMSSMSFSLCFQKFSCNVLQIPSSSCAFCTSCPQSHYPLSVWLCCRRQAPAGCKYYKYYKSLELSTNFELWKSLFSKSQ